MNEKLLNDEFVKYIICTVIIKTDMVSWLQ